MNANWVQHGTLVVIAVVGAGVLAGLVAMVYSAARARRASAHARHPRATGRGQDGGMWHAGIDAAGDGSSGHWHSPRHGGGGSPAHDHQAVEADSGCPDSGSGSGSGGGDWGGGCGGGDGGDGGGGD
jgi:hypothetical protein